MAGSPCCLDLKCHREDGTSVPGLVQQSSISGIFNQMCECPFDPYCPEEVPPPPHSPPLILIPPSQSDGGKEYLDPIMIICLSVGAVVLLVAVVLMVMYIRGRKRSEELDDVFAQNRGMPAARVKEPVTPMAMRFFQRSGLGAKYKYSPSGVQRTLQAENAKSEWNGSSLQMHQVTSNPIFATNSNNVLPPM